MLVMVVTATTLTSDVVVVALATTIKRLLKSYKTWIAVSLMT